MRMMVTATFPLQKFNKAVRNGTAGEKLGRIMDDIKPEAVYFIEQNGKRTCVPRSTRGTSGRWPRSRPGSRR